MPKEFGNRQYERETVRQKTRDTIISRYPNAFDTAVDGRWTAFLLMPHSSTFDDRRSEGLEETAKIYHVTAEGEWLPLPELPALVKQRRAFKIGRDILAGIAGKVDRNGKPQTNFVGKDFINERVRSTGIEIIVIEANHHEGLCRSVIPLLDTTVYNVIGNDLYAKPSAGQMVYLMSGNKRDKQAVANDLKDLLREAYAVKSAVDVQIRIHKVMNDLDVKGFNEARDRSFETVWEMALQKTGASREAALLHLRRYYNVPKQFFKVVTNGTMRLIPVNSCTTGMQRDLIKRIASDAGWYGLDMVSCQFAGCATLLRVNKVLTFFADGGSLWQRLYVDLETDATYKPGLKIGSYCAVFGMGIANIRRSVNRYFAAKNLQKALEAADGDVKEALASFPEPSHDVAVYLRNFLSHDPRPNQDVLAEDDGFGEEDHELISQYFIEEDHDGERLVSDLAKYFGAPSKTSDPPSKAFDAIMAFFSGDMGKRFIKHPLIAAFLEAREAHLEKITREGGGQDCFGTPISIIDPKNGKKNARRVLALQAQALELLLINSIFDTAENSNGNVAIMIYKYDGVFVRFKRNPEHWLKVIQKNFDETAKTAVREINADGTVTYYPVYTSLEVQRPN